MTQTEQTQNQLDPVIQQKLADAVSGKAWTFSVKDDETGEEREFKLKQPTFKLLIETSKILSEMSIENVQDFFDSKNMFSFISEQSDKVLKVITICVTRKVEYKQSDFDYFKNNLTPAEAYDVLANIVLRIGTQDFQKSIIATAPMSLFQQAEIIAASIPTSSQEGI